jgi:hypothetical protein
MKVGVRRAVGLARGDQEDRVGHGDGVLEPRKDPVLVRPVFDQVLRLVEADPVFHPARYSFSIL